MIKKDISYGWKELEDHTIVEDKTQVDLKIEQECKCGMKHKAWVMIKNLPKKEVEKFKVGWSMKNKKTWIVSSLKS